MSDRDKILSHANQDQELAGIRETWEATSAEDQKLFIGAMDATLSHESTRDLTFVLVNKSWFLFWARCAAAGLRQAVLKET
jgi:hypothetical protein